MKLQFVSSLQHLRTKTVAQMTKNVDVGGNNSDDEEMSLSYVAGRKRKALMEYVDDDVSVSTAASTLSTTSSFEADADSDSSTSSASCSTSTGKKSVRFDEGSNHSYDNAAWCREDVEEHCWYDANDYHSFKARTKALSKHISREANRNSRRRTSALSFEKVMERTFEVCRCFVVDPTADDAILTYEEEQQLLRWSETARLGLERWSVASLARDRKQRRRQHVDEVLGLIQDGASDECIRRNAERISRPSRLFARTIAESFRAAARKEEEHPRQQQEQDSFSAFYYAVVA